MSPYEILRGRIDEKTLKKIEGGKVIGIVFYSEKVDFLVELQERLVEILTSGNPDGFHKTRDKKEEWRDWRSKQIEEHGEDALVTLFPGEGHVEISKFLLSLGRGGIRTIPQLVENQDRLRGIRRFGTKGKRGEAARLIIDFFESQKA